MADHTTQRIIAVMNQTRDVGKTTITANLAITLAELNYRVLIMDLDPQSDLSRHFAVPETQPGMDVLLVQPSQFNSLLLTLNANLSLISSGPDLGHYEQQTPSVSLGVQLKQLLTSTSELDVDIILIDCAAISSLLGINAVLAATDILVPVSAEQTALRGMIKMLPVLRRLSKSKVDSIRLWLCINRLLDDENSTEQFGELLTQYFPKRVLKTVIYENPCASTADYQSLAIDLLMGRTN